MPEIEIQLRDVMVYARHGVMAEERVLGNQYRVNVRLRIDAASFSEVEDDLSMTISYAEVYVLLKSIMAIPAALLETVAVRFASEAIQRWPAIKHGESEIVKPVPPIPDMIGMAGVKYIF